MLSLNFRYCFIALTSLKNSKTFHFRTDYGLREGKLKDTNEVWELGRRSCQQHISLFIFSFFHEMRVCLSLSISLFFIVPPFSQTVNVINHRKHDCWLGFCHALNVFRVGKTLGCTLWRPSPPFTEHPSLLFSLSRVTFRHFVTLPCNFHLLFCK